VVVLREVARQRFLDVLVVRRDRGNRLIALHPERGGEEVVQTEHIAPVLLVEQRLDQVAQNLVRDERLAVLLAAHNHPEDVVEVVDLVLNRVLAVPTRFERGADVEEGERGDGLRDAEVVDVVEAPEPLVVAA